MIFSQIKTYAIYAAGVALAVIGALLGIQTLRVNSLKKKAVETRLKHAEKQIEVHEKRRVKLEESRQVSQRKLDEMQKAVDSGDGIDLS